jgi:hypothetical protein
MLRFPVSLLTATALIEAIKRVIRRRLSFTKLNAPVESLKSTSGCLMKHAAPGMAPRGNIPERESSDVEQGVLRATSAISKDIREVLGLSTVTISYTLVAFYILIHSQEKIDECEKWLELVRSVSEKPVRSKYFMGSPGPSLNLKQASQQK